MYVGMKVLILRMKVRRNFSGGDGSLLLELVREISATITAKEPLEGETKNGEQCFAYRAIDEDGDEWGMQQDSKPSVDLAHTMNWYNMNDTLQCVDIFEAIVNLDAVFALQHTGCVPIVYRDMEPYVPDPSIIGRCDLHGSDPVFYYETDLETKRLYATSCSLCASKLPRKGRKLRVGS